MTLLLVLPFALVFIAWVYATAPRSTARYVTEGDSDRVRRFESVPAHRDDDVLPVIDGGAS